MVAISLPKGKARARRGQRLETEMLQVARAADIPRIGDHEAALLVQVGKGAALVAMVGIGVCFERVATNLGCLAAPADLEGDRHREPASAPVGLNPPLECRTNRGLHRRVLCSDRRSGQHKAAEAAMPERIRIGDRVGGAVLIKHDIDQPGTAQQCEELLRLAEAQHGVALRDVGRWLRAELGDSLSEHPLDALAIGMIPPSHGDPSANAQHTD